MQEQNARLQIVAEPAARGSGASIQDSPVREYICSLATELAQMARREGDEPLGAVLEAAAMLAQRPA